MSEYSLLFVDDDEEMLESFSTWFTRHGFQVTAAGHPRQALAAVSNNDFDVAVLDVTLPEMSGIDLMEQLKGRGDMPFIMLSGHNDPALHADAIGRGAYRFLLKPFSLSRLETFVREAIIDTAHARAVEA